MLFHKFDPETNLYTESVESEEQPENSISGYLPEMTDQYTLALIDGELVSVTKPEPVITLSDAEILANRQRIANNNLNSVRQLRAALLTEADHKINEIEDNGENTSSLRSWRKALRECTDSLKKTNGDAKLSVESLIPSEFKFPSKG